MLIFLDRGNNFLLRERARVVDVDHLEDLSSSREELCTKFLVGRGRRLGAPLLLGLEVRRALLEAAVDRCLPCAHIKE